MKIFMILKILKRLLCVCVCVLEFQFPHHMCVNCILASKQAVMSQNGVCVTAPCTKRCYEVVVISLTSVRSR